MRYRFGDVELDATGRELRRHGRAVPLEPQVFDLLLYLLRNRDRVVSKDELLDRLWNEENVMEGALSVCVHRARAAVGGSSVIRTFSRRGYRFAAEVVELPDPPAGARVGTGPRLAGRRDEVTRLQTAVDTALAGSARIVLLAGEPGIGKTRLLDEVGAYARSRGAEVFWGEGNRHAGEPAFAIWADILTAYVGSRSAAEVGAVFGTEARLLAHILPGFRTPAGDEEFDDEEDDNPERLFNAAGAVFRRAAARAPLVLVLDDLDAVDADSLLALPQIARVAQGAPILVAGAYRDTGLALDHPLRGVLASLAGHEGIELIPLGRLEESDVGTLVGDLAGGGVPAPLLQLLVRRAEGNPLFASEYWRYLSRRGFAGTGNGEQGNRAGAGLSAVPPGVSGVIRERIEGLGPACRRVLDFAAALGRDFDHDVLAEAAGIPRAELDAALREASDARLVTTLPEPPRRYRFSHALVVDRLYASLLSDERAAIHRRIAGTLEHRYGDDNERHLSELAHHFLAGADDESADRAIEYAGRAADHAYAILAFREAALRFEQGLLVLDRHRPGSHQRRWHFLIGLAESSIRVGDVARAGRAYRRATETLPREGSAAACRPVRHASIEVTRALTYIRLALHVPPAEVDRFAAEAGRERRRSLDAAIEAARAARDPHSLLCAVVAARWNAFAGHSLGARLPLSTEAVLLAEQLNLPHLLQEARYLRIHDLLVAGLVAEADDELARHGDLASKLGDPFGRWTTSYMLAMRAIMEGRFSDAEQLARKARQIGAAVDDDVAAAALATQLRAMRSLQGRATELMRMIDPLTARHPAGDIARAILASLYCETDREEEARRELEGLAQMIEEEAHRPFWLHTAVMLVRPCARVGDTRLAERLFDMLRPYANASAVMPIALVFNGPISCHLAVLAGAAGRRKEAGPYFEQGMEDCLRLGVRPTLAHTQYEYARALLLRGGRTNRSKAITLLQRAGRTAGELEMPGLSKWIERLKAKA